MDLRNTPGGDIDWNDPMFHSTQFEESMGGESPYTTNVFDTFTNNDFTESPGIALRTPSKVGYDAATAAAAGAQQAHHPHMGMPAGASNESSSQDSASDSSSRRKRKVTESPVSDPATETGMVKKEETMMDIADMQRGQQQYDHIPTRPMHELSLEQDDGMGGHFDFSSAAPSPAHPAGFNPAMSLNQRVPITTTMAQKYQHSPVQTINPGMFQLGDGSPATNNAMMFNNPSPNAIFSTPSSDSNETFSANQPWSGMAQNQPWGTDFSGQFTSPPLKFTPSPIINGDATATSSRSSVAPFGKSPLNIAPISTKSRVETQINVIMTLEKPPPGIEYLHLPLHTIAKSKLLAKDELDKSKALELHTMLVCTSAMHASHLQKKALAQAASQNNVMIQTRAEQLRDANDDEKNDMKNVPEEDKPASGGEVRICSNCIQRERKRAGRKKLKKEEEQQHWERYETERVVVFNSNEYLPFKPPEQNQREAGVNGEEQSYTPPEGSMQVTAAMRIACYCRHQSEKEGFRVIFTLKDQKGNVVAQQMSDSILITDDHKTHPPSFSTNVPGEVYYQNPGFQSNGLPTSHSMVDLFQQQMQPFTSSRSTGNLQAMAYGQQQFHPHSHIHQLPNSAYTSQATSATMTPTSLSRPASPTSAGQSGPNKKRKSSSFHKRMPSGLAMTPRVDTSQPPSSTMPSALSVTSPFSPTGDGFGPSQQSYMTIPNHNGPAQLYGSGPPTPSENQHAMFTDAQIQQHLARAQNAQAYFSHPSSAVPSRASSPVLQQSRPNMAAYARQQPIQTSTNHLQGRQQMYQQQAPPLSTGAEQDQSTMPTMTKITPTEGPIQGGTEVSIYGYDFVQGTTVFFGEKAAATTFYGPQALLAMAPPSRPGGVNVTLVHPQGQQLGNQYISPGSSRQIFTYTDRDPKVMEMALRFYSQQQNGNQMAWSTVATQMANQFLRTGIGQAGIQDQSQYGGGGNMMAMDAGEIEDAVLKVLDMADVCESSRLTCYDLMGPNGETMLSLACARGMHRVAAALLARGANPDIRDMGGYTPLMHAAVHQRLKPFQLLLAQGADPSIRSLVGYAALDLVPKDSREEFERVLISTGRTRKLRRPSFRSRQNYSSSASSASCHLESEPDCSEPPSRWPSGHIAPASTEETSLDSQVQRVHGSVQRDISHLRVPPMPPTSTQDSCMLRRLSSVVSTPNHFSATGTDNLYPENADTLAQQPQSWDMFSALQSPSSAPPPAYFDLFPEKAGAQLRAPDTKKGVVDAFADQKRAAMFDQKRISCSTTSTETSAFAALPNKTARAATSPWLWLRRNMNYGPHQMA